MMPEGEIVVGVESFFTSYREAFERGDAAAVAEHFGESVHVASDTGSGVHLELMTASTWRSAIERLLALYRAIGVAKAESRRIEIVGVSERLAQASVRWELSDRGGRPLYEFRALYTITHNGTGWRIVAIAHDELPQSRRYLARHPPSGRSPEGRPPRVPS